jgi:hypothetical protein
MVDEKTPIMKIGSHTVISCMKVLREIKVLRLLIRVLAKMVEELD